MSKFKFIMAADPQYPWTLQDDRELQKGKAGSWHGLNPVAESYKDNADELAEMQVKSINALINSESASKSPIRGVMFNGDLVNYNGWTGAYSTTELAHFEDYYKKISVPIYCGLGNHDYEMNVDDTLENRGATYMLEYLIENCQANCVQSIDYKKVDDYDFPALRTTYTGSFSYSFDIENVHFVQLHYYPGYTKSWSNYRSDRARRYDINITKCDDWLKKDLEKAHADKKIIIVAYHQSIDDSSKYYSWFKEYGVSAVFVGHSHTSFGLCNEDIPKFYCGSTSQSNYILLEFEGNKLTATAISSINGDCKKIETAKTESIDLIAGEYTPANNPEGFVKFKSGGGYTVKFTLRYKESNGYAKPIETGRMLAGSDKEYTLPAGASEYEVTCLAWNGSSWKDKFDTYRSDTPFNCTFRTYGALPNPKMEIIKD